MSDNDRYGKENNSEKRQVVKDSGNTDVYRGRAKERATLSFDYDKGKKSVSGRIVSGRAKKPAAPAKDAGKADPDGTVIYERGSSKAKAPDRSTRIVQQESPDRPARTVQQEIPDRSTRIIQQKALNNNAKNAQPEEEGLNFDYDKDRARTNGAGAQSISSVVGSLKQKIAGRQEAFRSAMAERAERKAQEAALSAAIEAENEKKAGTAETKEQADKKEEKKSESKDGNRTEKQAEKKSESKKENKASKKPVNNPDKKIKKQSPVKAKKSPEKISSTKTAAGKKPEKKQQSGLKALSDRLHVDLPETGKSKTKNTKKTKKIKKRYKHRALGWLLAALKIMLALIIVVGITGGAYAAYTIAHAPKIHPEKIYDTLAVSTHIYDDKDDLISDLYLDENREIAKYDQFPENLKNAFIAIEDKTFWEHKGFNFRRIFGAVWNSLTGGVEISGTSTITQQLARNCFLPEEKSIRSIKRKIIEMYYAREIEEVLSKEEILTAYLNTIYLGYGCYGVDIAAKKYFSTEVEDLTLEECAALAALPQAPGVYALLTTEEGEATTKISDGLYANDISQERRYLTLDLMAEQGYISKEEADAAKKPIDEMLKPGKDTKDVSSAFKDYLIETVIADLMDQYDLTEDQASKLVYTKGLHIYSTLDSQAQKVVSREFREKANFPAAIRDNTKVESAMVISEIGTGKIKAMAGTRFADGDMLFNRATSPRQPGSSIKPLSVYAPALQKSYEYEKGGQKFQYVKTGYDSQEDTGWGDYLTVASHVSDEKMKVNGMNWPQNFGRTYTGSNTFRTAIQQSINTCAVKILAQVGLEYSMEKVKDFGISTIVDDTSQSQNDLNLAALGLGAMTYGVTPLEMSLAYATFPNGGVHNSGICYTKVTDSEGKVLLEGKSKKTKVLDEGVAWIMTDVLKSVVTNGIAGNAAVSGIMVGGKTGTTDETWDIWFDGFTPSYSGALWIGTDDNTPLDATSTVAAALWGNIMGQIDNATKGEYKTMPDNIIIRNGDYFTRGTEPPVIVVKKEKDKDKDKDKDKKSDKKEEKTEKKSDKKD